MTIDDIKDFNDKSRIMYNAYTSNSDEEKLPPLCNYLILIIHEDFEEIIPCASISKIIKIATMENRICRIYERNGSLGKNWQYLCDISKGVL